MPVSFHELWISKYLPKWREQLVRETEARGIAFLDTPHTVAGEELRALTPRDLLLLDGLGNPFTCGGDIGAGDIGQFFWLLHVHNDPARPWRSAWRKGRMIGRLRKRNYDAIVDAVMEFLEIMLMDVGGAPSKRAEGPQLHTSFLAPLLAGLAADMGGSDPASGLPLIESPLPRLLQYRKALDAKKLGKDFRDHAPSDAWLVECNEEANQINAAERAAAEAAACAEMAGKN